LPAVASSVVVVKIFGLTGGIGMGKSTAADLLRQRHMPVVDTDLIARQVVEPGQPALEEIERTFGKEMIDADHRLRRAALASRVFSDAGARRQLEAILHPRIRAIWQAQVQSWRLKQQGGVVVIPLLFETNAAAQFDAVICAACSGATQRCRLQQRGWSSEQIDQRLQAQWPIEKKMSLADFVVWTEGGLEICAAQLERVIGGTPARLAAA
jgi:dephospho-CoA kinase